MAAHTRMRFLINDTTGFKVARLVQKLRGYKEKLLKLGSLIVVSPSKQKKLRELFKSKVF
jgi:phage terminase small subunit